MTIFLIFSNNINPGDTQFMQKKTLQKRHVVDVAIQFTVCPFFFILHNVSLLFCFPPGGVTNFQEKYPRIYCV